MSYWKKNIIRLTIFGVLFSVLISTFIPVEASQPYQGKSLDEIARQYLEQMTAEERVGQLFLVTFKGTKVDDSTSIFDLVKKHHISGVVLRASNDNFINNGDIVATTYQLTSQLQQIAWQTHQVSEPTPSDRVGSSAYVPLLIGISQEGDGYPFDQILSGTTTLPNLMTIGATWDTESSRQIGSVLGSELQALGINLLFGPSLDVLDVSQTITGEDLGTRTFGGDPYWVGRLGRSYIEGLHEGSQEKLAVISKHFPGRGGSDRPPEMEIPTVRKSLEQLKQIELAPFFSVTQALPGELGATDGLLLSHIRYQGFQGNIRATTRPVSLDQVAFEQIMSLDTFAKWRQGGGLVVSDNLGSQAVRVFYDPAGTNFDARQVARSAFLAGNDLLYLDNFIATGDPDSHTTIIRTLELFVQRYNDDPAFSQKVNESALRVITLKLRLYPGADIRNVIPASEGLNRVGTSTQITSDVVKKAATLLNPDPGEFKLSLPEPPSSTDRIVFITDVLNGKQCSLCPENPMLPVNALEKTTLRYFGTSAGGNIQAFRLSSYSFYDLLEMLNEPDKETELEESLRAADWVVFAFLNIRTGQPVSGAFRSFLAKQPELLDKKKVVAFAFNAPYYLDATDIGRLSAYYGLYSRSPEAVNIAVRLLFQELVPGGKSPVSIAGLGYDLITATSPDPSQVIPLILDIPDSTQPADTVVVTTRTPQPTSVPLFRVGDTLPIKTGIIYDHNHNPVPDGTVVRFHFTTGGESGTVQQIETTTTEGIARCSFRIQTAGFLEIRATSDPATLSSLLQLDVSNTEAAAVTAIAPTSVYTQTPAPLMTMTPLSETEQMEGKIKGKPGASDWFLALFVILVSVGGIFTAGRRYASLLWGVRWGLLGVLGGWTGYVLIGLTGWRVSSRWSLVIIVLLGVVLGWLAGWFWWQQLGMSRQGPGRKSH